MALNRIVGQIIDKKYYILIFSVFLVLLLILKYTYLLNGYFDEVMSIGTYLAWHNLLELSMIIVAFTVFFVSYYTYDQTKSLRSIFLGCCLLAVGIIEVFHTLSFKGMPEFFVPNHEANRATTFWIISRLIEGIGFLTVSIIPRGKKSRANKNMFFIPGVILSLVTLLVVTWFPDFIPEMYIKGMGLTREKIYLEYTVILLLSVTIVKFLWEYIKTKDTITVYISVSLLIFIFSEVAFTQYFAVYDIYNYLGHILRIFAFFIIFKVIFITNVQKPYLKLSEAKNEIKNYADNLDKIVEERAKEIIQMNQRLMDDLDYARDIQKALLPSSFPVDKGVLFSARYFPAEKVGGDYYDIFRIDNENIGLCIGDVCGHGVAAAMLTVFLNESIEAVKEKGKNEIAVISPSGALSIVFDSFNRSNFKDDIFIVVFYAVYNLKSKELTYSSAGMNVAPLIMRENSEIEELELKGFPICKFKGLIDVEYHDKSIRLNKGDKILFYTDGLVEAQNMPSESFSQKGLKKLLADNSGKSCDELAEIVEKSIFAYINGGTLKDDVSFFFMQID